jgi:hypothetical protein
MSGDIFPMIRRMMKEIEAKEAKRTKRQKFRVFALIVLLLPLAFIIKRRIFQMRPGISPI